MLSRHFERCDVVVFDELFTSVDCILRKCVLVGSEL